MRKQDKFLDLYSDYLIASSRLVTATGLSEMTGNQVSHDQITRSLSGHIKTSVDLWMKVKKTVRKIQSPEGVIIFDDSIEEKPYTDENDIVCYHYDHTKGRSIKGIQFLTALYYSSGVSLPVNFEIVSKTEKVIDPKTNQQKRKSLKTKNELYREMLKSCVHNQIPFKYVLNDIWFASADNMTFIKQALKKDFVMPLKSNRQVALNLADKKQGNYQAVESVDFKGESCLTVYLEQVSFPMLLVKQVFTNKDDSTGTLFLVTSDLTLEFKSMTSLYQKRWKIEEYHKSIKQNASLSKSPTQTVTTQTNHFFAAIWAYVKLEIISIKKQMNHFAIKSQIYLSALKAAYQQFAQFA